MQMRRLIAASAVTTALGLVASPGAWAAARTFVSVSGSDAGDCSNVATPCRTFDAAITQVDVAGEVIVLDTGSYGGATITKSVKIDAPAGVVAFTAGTITINSASAVVTVRGVTLKALTPGTGTGIQITAASRVFVENCVIDGWGTGINVAAANVRAFVNDTSIRNISGLGVNVNSATALVSVDRSTLDNNSRPNNGCTVWATVSGAQAAIRNSHLNGNQFAVCASSGAQINVHSSSVSNNNSAALFVFAGGTGRASLNVVTGNGVGFSNSGTFESLGENLVRGNTTNTAGAITIVPGQ